MFLKQLFYTMTEVIRNSVKFFFFLFKWYEFIPND